MSMGCDKHGKVLLVLLNRKCRLGKVSYISRGNRPSINNFDSSWFLELKLGNLVLAGEFFIYKGIPSSTTVNEGMSLDTNITKGQRARNNNMLPVQLVFGQLNLRQINFRYFKVSSR